MSDLIKVLSYEGEGIDEVYNNGTWLLSIKNWRATNDVENIHRLEIHHTTDQQFMLISGKACLLLAPKDMDESTELQIQPLEIGKIYNLPVETWFNNVLSTDCKLMYCESADAGENGNSEYRELSPAQIEAVTKKVRAAM